jgi:mannose-1-phosphate guanylyltransferase
VVDVDDFRKVIASALDFTSAGKRIVTVGITPTRPETGYGYIQSAGVDLAKQTGDDATVIPTVPIHKVDSFREKPQLEVAKQYLAEGNYLWNAGIFVWNVDTIVESMKAFVPDLAAKMDEMSRAFYTADEPEVVRNIFPTCEKISIDYAVMEKADYIYTIPGDFGWSDVGTWGSLWTLLNHDENDNAVVGETVHLNDCRGCIVHAPGAKSVVLQGLEDSIVVERDGRLLICKLSEEQRIKDFKK